MLISGFSDILERRAAERAEKIAFIRTVVAVEVGKQAFKFIAVKDYALRIIAHGTDQRLYGRVDNHMTPAPRSLHLLRQRQCRALFRRFGPPLLVGFEFGAIFPVILMVEVEQRRKSEPERWCLAATRITDKCHIHNRSLNPCCREAHSPTVTHCSSESSEHGRRYEIDVKMLILNQRFHDIADSRRKHA